MSAPDRRSEELFEVPFELRGAAHHDIEEVEKALAKYLVSAFLEENREEP